MVRHLARFEASGSDMSDINTNSVSPRNQLQNNSSSQIASNKKTILPPINASRNSSLEKIPALDKFRNKKNSSATTDNNLYHDYHRRMQSMQNDQDRIQIINVLKRPSRINKNLGKMNIVKKKSSMQLSENKTPKSKKNTPIG